MIKIEWIVFLTTNRTLAINPQSGKFTGFFSSPILNFIISNFGCEDFDNICDGF